MVERWSEMMIACTAYHLIEPHALPRQHTTISRGARPAICEGWMQRNFFRQRSSKVFKCLVEEYLPSDKEWADSFSGNLPLFMVAASCENCAVSVIYHLLRRNVHDASTLT
jgi:hypothetical protein